MHDMLGADTTVRGVRRPGRVQESYSFRASQTVSVVLEMVGDPSDLF